MSDAAKNPRHPPSSIELSSDQYDATAEFNEETKLDLWSPRASPSFSDARRPSSAYHDDLSMNFFGTSFDSFEPTLRATFDREPPPFSPNKHLSKGRSSLPQRDITIPELKHSNDPEQSLGHISPIRVPYHDTRPQRSPPPQVRPHNNEMNWPCDCNGNVHAPVSNPFFVIRFAANAFAKVKYKLPCLADLRPTVNVNDFGRIRQYRTHGSCALDTKTATLRVEAAICAFGGTLNYPTAKPGQESIFRQQQRTAADTTKLSAYEKSLPNRYSMNGSRISWDVEENPPIVIVPSEERDNEASLAMGRITRDSRETLDSLQKGGTPTSRDSGVPLQRSIGIMVYPALNSFTAFEPGQVAPPLTNMNNFVSYSGDSDGTSHVQPSPAGGSVQPSRGVFQNIASITPEGYSGVNHWTSYRPPSPQSSLSGYSDECPPVRHRNGTMEHDSKRKRVHSQISEANETSDIPAKRNLFVSAVNLRPEHYRSVNEESSPTDGSSPYEYPAIPLTFSERKRLSDTLFFLSKEVPSLTQDCALALRDARENDEWDTAVAELMTQVIVGLFCTEDDVQLEGLQRYLLALGVSC